MIELNRGQAADETFRGCLHYFLTEVLPSCRDTVEIYVVTDGDMFDFVNYIYIKVKIKYIDKWCNETMTG